MKLAVRPSGLKRTIGWTESAGAGTMPPPARAPSSRTFTSAATPLTAPSACALTLESDPSMRTRTFAPSARTAMPVVVGRDHDADLRAAGGDRLARVARIAGHLGEFERVRRAERVHELATLARIVLIDDDRRDVGHGLIDESEQNELKERDRERDDECVLVARDVDELLAQNRDERAPKATAHDRPPR